MAGAIRILGVDPGTIVAGFACVELTERQRSGSTERRLSRGRRSGEQQVSQERQAQERQAQERQSGVGASPSRGPLAHRAGNVVSLSALGGAGAAKLVEAGVFRLRRNAPIASRLRTLGDEFRSLLERLEPAEIALEEAFFGKSVQSALRVGEARGVLLAEADRAGVEIHQYPPARIKRAVTGSGRATKEDVARFVTQQMGMSEELSGPRDLTDALATALCRVEERRTFIGG